MSTYTDRIIAALTGGPPLDRAAVMERVAGADRRARKDTSTIIGQMLRRGQLLQREDGILAPNLAYEARGRGRPSNTKPAGTAIARAHNPPKPPRAAEHTDTRTQHARDLARDLVANVEDATESLITMIDQICEDHPDLALAVRMQRRAVSMLRAGHALVEA